MNIIKYNYKFKNIIDFFDKSIVPSPIPYSIIFKCNGLNNDFEFTNNCFCCLFCYLSFDEIQNKYKIFWGTENLIRYSNLFFKGNIIKPLDSKSIFASKSLNEFTSYDETANIQPWATGILNSLSQEPCICSMELPIQTKNSKRSDRIDIGIRNSNNFFVFIESKVTLDSMLNEDRFVEQHLKYNEILLELTNNTNIEYSLIFLIGGDERDLLPPGHQECTSMVGKKAERFYNLLLRYNIKFISAHALLGIALNYSILNDLTYSWDIFFKKFFYENDKNIALLSSGIVKKDFSIIPLKNDSI